MTLIGAPLAAERDAPTCGAARRRRSDRRAEHHARDRSHAAATPWTAGAGIAGTELPGPPDAAHATSLVTDARPIRTDTIPLSASHVSPNRQAVERYMESFSRTDHPAILDTLTEDVEWVIPGAFHVEGRNAFDARIEDDAFEGHPAITVSRLIEQGDVVVAEGVARGRRRDDGGEVAFAFCDVFELRDGRIRKLTSYVMPVAPDAT